jgi:hypothetical protein
LLFSAKETASYISRLTEGFHVFFWEDDNNTYTIKLDNKALMDLVHSAANAFIMIAIKLLPKASWPVVAGVLWRHSSRMRDRGY